jgi:hypothetical protein
MAVVVMVPFAGQIAVGIFQLVEGFVAVAHLPPRFRSASRTGRDRVLSAAMVWP